MNCKPWIAGLVIFAACRVAAADGRIPVTGPANITQPGSYYLTRDFTVSTGGYALTLNGNDITLDLAGHTITQASLTWVIAAGGNNLRITGGTLAGGTEGVNYTQSAGLIRVDHMILRNQSAAGIHLIGVSGSPATGVIQGNLIKSVSSGSGIYCEYVDGAEIAENVIRQTGGGFPYGNGMYFAFSNHNFIHHNTVTASADIGIWLTSSQDNRLDHNNVLGTIANNAYGVWIQSSNNNVLEWNDVSNGGYLGMVIESSNNNFYDYNRNRNNVGGNGITLMSGTGNTDGGGNF
jgi:parallel beta-helix repeat protein